MLHRACLLLAVFVAACSEPPATIEYIDTSPAHPRIGEITTVRFKLTDYRGVPQAGTTVTFSLDKSTGDSVMFSPKTAISVKGSGEVQVQLVANANPGTVIVRADAGGGKVATSPGISFAGTYASGTQMTFQCGSVAGEGSGGVHALGAYDELRHLIAGVKVHCVAHVGDRNGDGVPGASVSFYTEAGTIGPSETTVTDVIGNASILYKTSLPLPVETTPRKFEWDPNGTCEAPGGDTSLCNGEYLVPLWMSPNSWTRNPLATALALPGAPAYDPNNLEEPRRNDPIRKHDDAAKTPYQNNPRDNLVSMIAFTPGEEGFYDANHNAKWDDGEEFIDTTEPFVDSNDNGTWDSNERYLDTNGNMKWDGKNGKWDAVTTVWRQERILWTGIPYQRLYGTQPDDKSGPEPTFASAQVLAGTPILTCKGPPGPSLEFTTIIGDPWFNSLAQNAEGDGCEKIGSSDNVEVEGTLFSGIAFTYPPIGRHGFVVIDKSERTPMPMTTPPQPGCFPPPTPRMYWSAVVACKFTASPEEGYRVTVPDSVTGQVDSNLP